jgi:hypothetical protein
VKDKIKTQDKKQHSKVETLHFEEQNIDICHTKNIVEKIGTQLPKIGLKNQCNYQTRFKITPL